ncbi:MAG: hypothetical protein R2795_21470 [Saprospiraceae bacterium]
MTNFILSCVSPDSYRDADASGIDCAFCLVQNKICSLSLNQENLDILLDILLLGL